LPAQVTAIQRLDARNGWVTGLTGGAPVLLRTRDGGSSWERVTSLGASFLTLVVAENVGVTSGLGWYFNWAQTNAEYGKLYGAIIIMAVFFSTIMTLLFKVRDHVLVWQKGQIKW
jgi:hypothetical protein